MEVTIVREGRPGILGLGADAIVRVTPRVHLPEGVAAESALGMLETLLSLMEVDASVVPQAPPPVEKEEETVTFLAFDIKGDDLGILIGRRGQTLASLQYLLRLMVSNQTKTRAVITLDVEGYKERRLRALQVLARNIAEQVKAKGEPFALEPMPAYERRIIHLVLADHPDVTTESTGLGDFRKVVIMPKNR